MKRSLFRLPTVWLSLFLIICLASSVVAQGNGKKGGGGGGGGGGEDPPSVPFQYQIQYANLPTGITSLYVQQVEEVNGEVVAVGRFTIDGKYHGFIYNFNSNQLTDVYESFGIESSCRAINANGIVIGNAVDELGNIHVYWFDSTEENPAMQYLENDFPEIGGFIRQTARDVNIHGDMLVDDTNNNEVNAYLVNPFTGESYPLDLLIPTSITDSGFVLSDEGYDGTTDTHTLARWSPLLGKETFSDLKLNVDFVTINEIGEFGALIDSGSGARGTPCRVGISNQIDWAANTVDAYYVSTLNDTGDLGYMETVTSVTGKGRSRITITREKVYFYHASENQVFAIDSLVNDTFLNSSAHEGIFLTNRDTSLSLPTPVISGAATDGNGEWRIYALFPIEP